MNYRVNCVLCSSGIDSWTALAPLADLITPASKSRVSFLQELKCRALDGIVAICDRAPSSLATTGRWDEELLSALPSSVKFICHNGAGYDNIDVSTCTEKGIVVSNCPSVVDDATADTAIFLILAAVRGFNNGILAIRNRTWTGAVPPPPLGHDLHGKILGILGYGGIGRNLKRKAETFGMSVIYHSRRRLSKEIEDGAEYVGFEELLGMCDILSLNLPLNVSNPLFLVVIAYKLSV